MIIDDDDRYSDKIFDAYNFTTRYFVDDEVVDIDY